MSDTGEHSKTEKGNAIMVPVWLYRMPDDWYEAYFNVALICAVSLRWGRA